jgi:CHAT domain-containing protein
MSLARGFYYAGAKNIITSLWRVDDRSTAGIFGDFYSHLSGNDYSNALYNAKLSYLQNATDATASPYYWAGFIHIGQQRQPAKSNLLIYIIAITAILLASILIYRRKRSQG